MSPAPQNHRLFFPFPPFFFHRLILIGDFFLFYQNGEPEYEVPMSEGARVPAQPISHLPNAEAYEGNYGRLDAGDLEPSEVIIIIIIYNIKKKCRK